ncbi:MAG: NUDIX domain-containing protein [Dehalococcoidia bacterium]|nr:NUDIX domain-containing protein [Dehalococcoidia bacterium]
MKPYNPMQNDSVISTCGGVVFADDKILFILKNDKWDLPKGRMEDGETKEETSLREISEETGLEQTELQIIEQLPTTYYYKKVDGKKRIKKTTWFFVKYTGNSNTNLTPTADEGISECRWIPVSEIPEALQNTHARITYLMDFVNQKHRFWN